MKTTINLLIFLLYLSSINGLYAQPGSFGGPVIPYQLNESPLFGKDIIIHDMGYQNQRCVAICSAYNGWLYAIFSHSTTDTSFLWSIMKSTDNGITWIAIVDGGNSYGYRPLSFGIVACGSDSSNIKVFTCAVDKWDDSERTDFAVEAFDGLTGNWLGYYLAGEGQDFTQYSNCSIASDYQFPANISSPYSLGILYTKSSLLNYYRDSLIFLSSSDGGVTLNNKQVVAVAKNLSHKFGTVTLSYGYSPTWNSGRYFAAWEDKDTENANLGHIYTSHTNTEINSQFSKPICLDSLDASSINLLRNPRISCQTSITDNDSSNLTQVVIFEKYSLSSNSFDLAGCYNLQAASTSYFKSLNLAVTNHNEMQPEITFNDFDNTFYVTYYDSTAQKLPLVVNNVNMASPDDWNVISNGYNNDPNLITPHPEIAINPTQHECANVWIAERGNGNGVAMFDAQYSTYTGIPFDNRGNNENFCRAFPNPCNQSVTFDFTLKRTQKATITLCNLQGQNLAVPTDQIFLAGRQQVKADVSRFNPGSYFYKLETEDYSVSGKISVMR